MAGRLSELTGIQIFTGTAHPELGRAVADYLDLPLSGVECSKFADGESIIRVQESARGNDAYVIQPTCRPVNDNLVELGQIIDGLKRSSVSSITAVIPYYGYARQDKKLRPREPMTAKLVALWLEAAGVNHVITVDLHSDQIPGFFEVPVDNLQAGPILGDYYRSKYAGLPREALCAVSPDVGGIARATALARHLNCRKAVLDKSRPRPNEVEIGEVIGDVEGRRCIVIDDLMDTCNTLVFGAEALLKQGALAVDVACTHPILSGDAAQKLQQSGIGEVVCLDTMPIPAEKRIPKMTVLSVAALIGEAIKRHHLNESVSGLFANWRR
jgi:ribose-phosphate pyrophosphokinase